MNSLTNLKNTLDKFFCLAFSKIAQKGKKKEKKIENSFHLHPSYFRRPDAFLFACFIKQHILIIYFAITSKNYFEQNILLNNTY